MIDLLNQPPYQDASAAVLGGDGGWSMAFIVKAMRARLAFFLDV